MTKLIVFDLDDTLYPEVDFVRSGFTAVDAWLSRELGVAGFFAEAWRLFEGGRRGDVFDLALSRLTFPATRELIRELVAVYRDHPPTIKLAPDALRVLQCRGNYLGFAVLTDGYKATQQRKIDALQLDIYCNPILRTDCWGRAYWKPHPRGFLAIQDHFGLPASSLVYVADNPEKDFIAPRALGWKSIRIKRDGGLHGRIRAEATQDAHLTITSLDELAGDPARDLFESEERNS